ncbi:hypothetical protein [Nannocystis exedens]|uniref:hypothetical protein n=1 Tax=Nannocystis exedens TaxID=54 RepID=UPI001160D092|nr:hypothetical protein [Nannocystis exedens]
MPDPVPACESSAPARGLQQRRREPARAIDESIFDASVAGEADRKGGNDELGARHEYDDMTLATHRDHVHFAVAAGGGGAPAALAGRAAIVKRPLTAQPTQDRFRPRGEWFIVWWEDDWI